MEDTKEKILSAAQELISQNGLADTTIAKIARKSDIADSLVYQYFKGKEDLLFSIAYRNIQIALEMVDDQLQGIMDPVSQLSKFIWYTINYNEKKRDYASILMFECHSNINYYSSPAYELHQKYFSHVVDILHQGMEAGVFRNDLDTRLMMEIVTGILGAEIIDSLIPKKIEAGSKDFNDIMNLILPMILLKEENFEKNKGKRILNAALEIFSEYGFAQAKISQIAKRAKVAEGTIYEYFQSKDDLLVSLPQERFERNLKNLNARFLPNTSIGKLQGYFKHHVDIFLSNPDFLKVFILHIMLHPAFYGTPSYRIYADYNKILENIVEEGKNNGSFRSDANTRLFCRMFFGAFHRMAIRWFITEKDTVFDKMTEVNSLIKMLTSAIISES